MTEKPKANQVWLTHSGQRALIVEDWSGSLGSIAGELKMLWFDSINGGWIVIEIANRLKSLTTLTSKDFFQGT